MLMKEEIILSFFKGIAKTSGVVTILALVGGVWYIVNETMNCYTNDMKGSEKEDNDVIVDDNVLSTKDDTMSYVEDINIEDSVESSKFKHIFDKIIS
jgi:hypothetical protein